MARQQKRGRTSKIRRGVILVDALVGIFIVGLGAVAYWSMLPVVHRSQQIAQQESKAAQIASRLTEQISMLKPSEVTVPVLNQMGVIDANQSAQPWSFTNIPLDDGTSYSPAKVLRNGTGQITTAALSDGSVLVRIQLNWNSPTGAPRSLVTGTVIGGYR